MKLTVHLVAWNGATYIPYLFDSLRNQSFKDWELVVLDNNSTDNTAELIEHELQNWSGTKRFIKNSTNAGFAGGHNLLYAQTDSEYFLLLNQDLYLQPDCLEILVKELESKSQVATVSPRLMKWNFNQLLTETGVRGPANKIDLEKSFTDVVDSLGLKVLRSRRVVEISGGERFNSTGQRISQVFGVSGTLPLLRRTAINKIAFSAQEFLDNSYGSYKEDVDLAFRLQSAGYRTEVVLNAVAYHDRSAAGPVELSDAAAAENKKKQSSWVKYHSYKNHIMTLYKNEYWQNLILDFLPILWYELKKFVWFLFFKPSVLKGLEEVWKNRKSLKEKRNKIVSIRKNNWQQLRTWWN